MSEHEAKTATPISLLLDITLAMAEDEDGFYWYHVCELKSDGLWYSFFASAELEAALKVYELYV